MSSSVSSSSSLLIFLDVDGVLVPVSPMSFGGGDFDSACVARLGEIVAIAGGVDAVTIIVSSTWRHDPAKMQRLNDAFASSCGNTSSSSTRTIPPVSLGVPNGVPNPTLTVTYLKKDPSEQKLVKERVDEICYFLEQHREAYPAANISVEEPTSSMTSSTIEAAAAAATSSADLGAEDNKKKNNSKKPQGGGPPAAVPMRKYPGRWFAIDDMDLGVDPRMQGHFLKTDIEEGITPSDVVKAQSVVDGLAPAVAVAVALVSPADADTKAEASPARVEAAGGEKKPTLARSGKSSTNLPLGIPLEGLVKRYNPNRGFGFLRCNGEDIFVHQLHVLHDGFRGLNVAEPVCFEVAVDGETGRVQAVKVQQLSAYRPTCKVDPLTGLLREAGGPHQHQEVLGGGEMQAAGTDVPSGKQHQRKKDRTASSSGNGATGEPTQTSAEQDLAAGGGVATATTTTILSFAGNSVVIPAQPQQQWPKHRKRGPRGGKQGNDQSGQYLGLAGGTGSVAAGGGAHPTTWRPRFPRPADTFVLPLVPDGFGFRCANGTVFYPVPPPPPPPYMPDDSQNLQPQQHEQ